MQRNKLAFLNVVLLVSTVFAGCSINRQKIDPFTGKPAVILEEGTVLQFKDGGRYKYAEVKAEKDKIWIAAPKANVKVGDTVRFSRNMPMKNFKSKALNRTFDVLYFSGRIGAPPKPEKFTGQKLDDSLKSITGKVLQTMDSGRYTYVLVQSGNNRVWIAAPAFKVKTGMLVTASTGMLMKDFYSRTLNAKFDYIYFTGKATIETE